MNKQEALKRVEAQKKTIIELSSWAVYVYIVELIKSLDEPQKPVVPQFVADWIEKCKAKEKNLLNSLVYTPEGVNSWMGNSDNQELFARAWLDGYEVEKEKRYLVKVKGVEDCSSYLKRNTETNKLYFGEKFSNAIAKDLKIYHIYHTRKELEDAGFGWVFDCEGIEIEEVE